MLSPHGIHLSVIGSLILAAFASLVLGAGVYAACLLILTWALGRASPYAALAAVVFGVLGVVMFFMGIESELLPDDPR